MVLYEELFNQYDQLLPPKFAGGYLIIALAAKIKEGYFEEPFKIQHIEETLEEINTKYKQDSLKQWARIKDNLLQYYIRNYPDEPGHYYLTDYAHTVIEVMQNKLHNPYKTYKLKESFELSFYINFQEITSIEDLERKFGRLFITGAKKIVTDHIEALEDELREAYATLNSILTVEKGNAVELAKKFASAFAAFGIKATDITMAMNSKDNFLRDLQQIVDQFYEKAVDSKSLNNASMVQDALGDWERSKIIYVDISDFFKLVDNKIALIRRQINNASEKLSELQEYFSARVNFRLNVQKLLNLALSTAEYTDDGLRFADEIPLKPIVYERPRMFYLRHIDFGDAKPNVVIQPLSDQKYEAEERDKIEVMIQRQQIINEWCNKAKEILEKKRELVLDNFMDEILESGQDLSIAYQVAAELISFSSEQQSVNVEVKTQLTSLKDNILTLWKTRLIQ